MTGIPLQFSSSNDSYLSEVGFFLKFGNDPPNNTCLVDLKCSTTAYFRLTLTPDPSIIAEVAYLGKTCSLPLQVSTLLSPGGWNWVTCAWGADNSVTALRLRGQIWRPGSLTDGPVAAANGAANDAHQLLSCDFGWGVHLSASNDDFPRASGWEMTSLYLKTYAPLGGGIAGLTLQTPPISDLSPTGRVALYLCHQTLGPAASIVDSTANHYDLTPGGNGANIVADGPY